MAICEGMVPGGWLSITREPTTAAAHRFAAWCGLRIDQAAPEVGESLVSIPVTCIIEPMKWQRVSG